MYHRGESIENIRNKIDGFHPTCSDIDYEILNTAYALAMWEIGELTEGQLHDIKDCVLGASNLYSVYIYCTELKNCSEDNKYMKYLVESEVTVEVRLLSNIKACSYRIHYPSQCDKNQSTTRQLF